MRIPSEVFSDLTSKDTDDNDDDDDDDDNDDSDDNDDNDDHDDHDDHDDLERTYLDKAKEVRIVQEVKRCDGS